MQSQFSNLKINTLIEIFVAPHDKNHQSKKNQIMGRFFLLETYKHLNL